jgi:hypothetical protein
MRDAALASLEKIVTRGIADKTHAVSFEAFVPSIATALLNSVGRTELLQFTNK